MTKCYFLLFLFLELLHRCITLHRTETRMIRWTYGVKLRDKLSSIDLRQRLGIEDLVKVAQKVDYDGK